MTTPSSFLILHGFENRRPPNHWQRWLSLELTARGHDVRYPQLPDPEHPDPEAWRRAMLTNLATLTEGTVTVVCHSLSCLVWLNEQGADDPPRVDRVVLVAPPEASVVHTVEAIGPFAWTPAEGAADRQFLGAPDALVVASDNDRFVPSRLAGILPHVEARGVEIAGAGHFTPADGYGPWPAVLDWCEGLGGL